MRRAYHTLDLTEAVLLKDHLVQNGVAATVMNDGATRIPHHGVAPEVWVADDATADQVRALIRTFVSRRTAAPVAAAWRCSSCREENPGEFQVCWNCGHAATEA